MTIRIYLFIFIAFMGMLSFTSFLLTRAYFTDTASASFSLSTANEFDTEIPQEPSPSASPTPTTTEGNIVINEIYVEGGQNSEWIELYNSSNSVKDISGWKIKDNSSTFETWSGSFLLPAGGYAVIVASGSSITVPSDVLRIQSDTTLLGGGLTNSDRLELLNNSDEVVDRVSWGDDNAFFSGIQPPSLTKSLQRISNGKDTDTASDWSVGLPSMGFSNN